MDEREKVRSELIALFVRRGHKGIEIAEEVKEILSLPALREMVEKATGTCEWTWEKELDLYSTSCDDAWPLHNTFDFCPRCGKRIEVKDGQG